MTPSNLHTINSSLLALPVAIVFTRRLLLNYKSPATAEAGSLDDKLEVIHKRAHGLTETLKGIVGYNSMASKRESLQGWIGVRR
jgi:hypothetical protein